MGKFYVHKDGIVRWTGVCPDGMEDIQGLPGYEVGLGDPPANLTIDSSVPPESYEVKRKREYPSVGDQLDALWRLLGPPAQPNSPAADIYRQIQAVKQRNPKP